MAKIALGTSKAVKEIEKCYILILEGRILCIDPSVGSASSMPGYAIYENQKLIDKGTIDIDVKTTKKHVGFRLQELGKSLREEFKTVDVLVIEDIPPFRAGGTYGANKAHVSLLKSVGCIFGSAQFEHLVNIHPRTWQKWRDENYAKTDDKDAEYIGIAAIGMAKIIRDGIEKKEAKKLAKEKK